MEYLRKLDLQELRKSNKEVELFAVYRHLGLGVFKIKKMTKQYIYWEDDSKHSYPSPSVGYSLFDNEHEAWNHYLNLHRQKTEYLEAEYKQKQAELAIADKFISDCKKSNPELII